MTRSSWEFLPIVLLFSASRLAAAPQTSDIRPLLPNIPFAAAEPAPPTAAQTAVAKFWQTPQFRLPAGGRSERDLAARVLSYLESHAAELGLDVLPPLRLDFTRIVPGARGIPDQACLRFVETHRGVDVAGSQLVATLRLDAGGAEIASIEGTLFPDVRTTGNWGAIDPAQARDRVRARLSPQVEVSAMRVAGETVRWLRGAWRVTRDIDVPVAGLRVAIDEATGEADAWNTRLHDVFTAKVTGRLVLFNPQTTPDLPAAPLENLSVTGFYTDAAGMFSLPSPPLIPIPLTLNGRWAAVTDQNLTPLGAIVDGGLPSPAPVVFNPDGTSDTNTAQVNAYYHTDLIHNWIVSKGVAPAALEVPLPVNVNWKATCDSFFDGYSINFFKAGNGCVNTAYDTLVYHEYAHFVDSAIGGITNGALSEGWGDLVATYASGQPLMGEGFYSGDPASFVRNASNNYQYNSADEIHTQGQAWMGFAWDLRSSLVASLGPDAGAALAENLVLPVFFNNSPDIPSAVRAVAVRDGLSGTSGGAHYPAILAAAARHGLAFILDITPPSVKITFPADSASPPAGRITLQGTASDDVAVTKVSVEVDGTLIGPAVGLANWTLSLDTTLLAAGTHVLTARAFDAQGNQGSSSIRVTVAPSGITPFVTSVTVSSASLSNALPPWSGMAIRVGAAPLTVTSLGRIYVPGNAATHTLKIVDGDTGADLPGASVDVTMAPPAFSQFVYGDLPAAVTLAPGHLYFVVTGETSADLLYATALVQTTAAATLAGAADYRRAWVVDPSPTQTLGPVDFRYRTAPALLPPSITSPLAASATVGVPFRYVITATNNATVFQAAGLPPGLAFDPASGTISGTPEVAGVSAVSLAAANIAGSGSATLILTANATAPPPPPTLTGSGFVVSAAVPGAVLTNQADPWSGMAIRVGTAPVTVHSLGRYYVAGNSGPHTVKIVDAATGFDVPGASVSVVMAPPSDAPFVYGDLPAPVTLAAGAVYYIVSEENWGGDASYSLATVQTSEVAAVLGPASYRRAWTVLSAPNQTYGPVDFR